MSRPYTGNRLGEVLYQAKLGVGAGAYEKDIINSFGLIGDPALKLPADLYAAAVVSSAPAPAKKKKGIFGFGCSANAADGGDVDYAWGEGLLELALYLMLILCSIRGRRVFRK